MTKIQLIPIMDDRNNDFNSVELNSTNIYDSLNNSVSNGYANAMGINGQLGFMMDTQGKYN